MSRAVELAHERNEIVCINDGYYYYWPNASTLGAFSEHNLRDIADELERLNKDYDNEINNYFNNQEKLNGENPTL